MTNIDKIANYVKASVDGKLLDKTPINQFDDAVKKNAKDILGVMVEKIEYDTKFKQFGNETRLLFKYTYTIDKNGKKKDVKNDGFVSMYLTSDSVIRYVFV